MASRAAVVRRVCVGAGACVCDQIRWRADTYAAACCSRSALFSTTCLECAAEDGCHIASSSGDGATGHGSDNGPCDMAAAGTDVGRIAELWSGVGARDLRCL